MEIDNKYWEGLEDADGKSDVLASAINQLKIVTSMLDISRQQLVIKTARSFSDILSMIAEFNEDGESLYDTATKLCDFYRKNKDIV